MLLFIQEVSVMRQSDSVSEELDTENVQCCLLYTSDAADEL